MKLGSTENAGVSGMNQAYRTYIVGGPCHGCPYRCPYRGCPPAMDPAPYVEPTPQPAPWAWPTYWPWFPWGGSYDNMGGRYV